MSTCRFCKKDGDNLIHYNVRHYAHADCGLKAKGAAFFDTLTDWQCTRFPYMAAKRAGVEKVLEARAARYRAELGSEYEGYQDEIEQESRA